MGACDRGPDAATQAELEKLRAENAALAQRAEAESSDRTGDKTQITQLAQQLKDAADRVTDLTRELTSAKELREAAAARYESLVLELDEARSQIADLQGALSRTTQEAQAAVQRYESELASLRDQVTDLQAKLAEALRSLNTPGRLRDLLPGQNPPPPP